MYIQFLTKMVFTEGNMELGHFNYKRTIAYVIYSTRFAFFLRIILSKQSGRPGQSVHLIPFIVTFYKIVSSVETENETGLVKHIVTNPFFPFIQWKCQSPSIIHQQRDYQHKLPQ